MIITIKNLVKALYSVFITSYHNYFWILLKNFFRIAVGIFRAKIQCYVPITVVTLVFNIYEIKKAK